MLPCQMTPAPSTDVIRSTVCTGGGGGWLVIAFEHSIFTTEVLILSSSAHLEAPGHGFPRFRDGVYNPPAGR